MDRGKLPIREKKYTIEWTTEEKKYSFNNIELQSQLASRDKVVCFSSYQKLSSSHVIRHHQPSQIPTGTQPHQEAKTISISSLPGDSHDHRDTGQTGEMGMSQ